MTFEQLFYFCEVYRQNSINSAAEKLHISRQCLSKSIRKLEDELNCQLFERSVSGTTATSAAKLLYTHSSKILNEYGYLKKNMLDFSIKQNAHSISIGIPEALLSIYGEHIIESLEQQFPDVRFHIYLTDKKNTNFYLDYDIAVFASLGKINRINKSSEKYHLTSLYSKPVYMVQSNKSNSQI